MYAVHPDIAKRWSKEYKNKKKKKLPEKVGDKTTKY